MEQKKIRDRTVQTKDVSDPLPIWNYLQVGDLLSPKVLVCKAGRFLERLNQQTGQFGDSNPYPKADTAFGNAEFEDTCDPSHLVVKKKDELGNEDGDSGTADEVAAAAAENDAVIIGAKSASVRCGHQILFFSLLFGTIRTVIHLNLIFLAVIHSLSKSANVFIVLMTRPATTARESSKNCQ